MVMLLMQIITFVAMYIWISDYSKVLFGLSTVLSAVLIIFEINRTEESTFKMTWITLIAIIPIFGALFYLFTRAQGVSMNIGDDYKNIQEANKKYLVQDNDVMKNIYQTDKNQDGFARYLSKYGGTPAYTNTGVQYYSIGERMFEDMKKNIKNWNDDKEIVDTFVLKTIKRFDEKKGANQELLPEFKDDEDQEFARRLIRRTILTAA